MKRKLLPQDLADFLASHEGIAHRDAENFVRAFFEVIEAGLTAEKFVKIKGLGTFKLVSVSERESININTGERFQIEGHSKVSFTPDNAMKALVNRPFAHFETVDLSDETQEQEFAEVDKEIEEMIQAETATEEATQPEERAEREEEPEKQPVEPTRANEMGKGEETKKTPSTENTEAEQSVAESLQLEESIEQPTAETLNENADTSGEEAVKTTEEPAGASCSPYRYDYIEEAKPRKRNPWKTAAIILALLLLMILCYFAGYFRVLCPCSPSFVDEWLMPAETEQVQPAPMNPAPAKKTDAKTKELPPAKPAPNGDKRVATPPEKATVPTNSEQNGSKRVAAPQKDAAPPAKPSQGGDKSAVATTAEKPKVHRVRVGDNLTKISRRYYGSDKYVQAIMKANGLKDSDNVPLGMLLKLP